MVFLQEVYKYVSSLLLIYNKEYLKQCSQSTPIEDRKFDFKNTMTFLSEKLASSVIESVSENDNQSSSSSGNETLPGSPIKQKCKWRWIQLLCAEECSEEKPPESYERKLGTVESGRNCEVDNTEKVFEKGEDVRDIQSDSKRKATMFYPLKVVKEIIVIKSYDESNKIL